MRIGDFAQLHHLSSSSVRYYVKQGLLTPRFESGHWFFGPEDDADAERLAQLKDWGLSLTEIRHILAEMRLLRDSVEPVESVFEQILRRKRGELLQEQQRITGALQSIDCALQSIDCALGGLPEQRAPRGVDTRFLSFLGCPVCGRQVTIALDKISAGKIENAVLTCSCGYEGYIRNGILCNPIGTVLPTPPLLRRDVAGSGAVSPDMKNGLYQIYTAVESLLSRHALENRLVIETQCSRSSFLIQKAKALNPAALYILSDPLYENILQDSAYMSELALNILPMVSNYRQFPIRPGCADYMIDCQINSLFGLFLDYYLLPQWIPYLHVGSKIIGAFMEVSANSTSARRLQAQYPGASGRLCEFKCFKSALSEYGFTLDHERLQVEIRRSGYPWHVEGEPLKYYCYCATYRTPRRSRAADRD